MTAFRARKDGTFLDRQIEILRLIGDWPGEDLPRPQNLARALGYADESGVRFNLKQFEERGLIVRIDNGPRVPKVLRLTDEGRVVAGLAPTGAPSSSAREMDASCPHLGVPLIPARCGFKSLNGEGELSPLLIAHLFPKWRGDDLDHALIAENDSMVAPEGSAHPETIFEGDLVHGREGIEPGNHARVYVEYNAPFGRDCALKIMEPHGKKVVLRSLNPAYAPVEVAARDIVRCYLVLDVRSLQRGDTK